MATPVRCLVVDDDVRIREVLLRVLGREGYFCREAESAARALEQLERESFDLLLSDIQMPGMDGRELLVEVRRRWPEVGVVMVSAVTEIAAAVECLQVGALDYVPKPFQVEEVKARLLQALEKRRLILENRQHQVHLEERVAEQARRIAELFLQGVEALAHALEAKDPYTRGHSARVATYSTAIARELALEDAAVEEIRLGAELHDIGKIGVREAVLFKPGALTDEEYRHIMQHPVIGERILKPLLDQRATALAVVRSHHERVDGRGLPDGLAFGAIPLGARIAAVADAFDAMTTGRPYRGARAPEVALQELRANVGTQFDAEPVAAFARVLPDLVALSIAAAVAPVEVPEAAVAAAREAGPAGRLD